VLISVKFNFSHSAYCCFRLFRSVKSLVYSLFDITIHKVPSENQIKVFQLTNVM